MDVAAGVDIGATRLRVALADDSGKIVARESESITQRVSKTALGAQVTKCISRLLEENEVARPRCIGVATTGPLDRRVGIVNPANLQKLGFVPLAEPLLKAFGRPLVLMNDCTAAVIAERDRRREFDNLAYVTLSTGIGAGVFVDRHLLMGKDGNAHEVGHLVIDMERRLVCGCGKAGHWEAYCSGRNIPRLAGLVLDDAADARRVGMLDSPRIFKLSKKGDEACARVVREVGLLNAMGFANIVDVYDPELIVVGGAVALFNADEVLGPIREMMGDFARNRVPPVELTEMGEDAVLLGAVLAALHTSSYPELKPWTYAVR
jgi:glucokinase